MVSLYKCNSEPDTPENIPSVPISSGSCSKGCEGNEVVIRAELSARARSLRNIARQRYVAAVEAAESSRKEKAEQRRRINESLKEQDKAERAARRKAALEEMEKCYAEEKAKREKIYMWAKQAAEADKARAEAREKIIRDRYNRRLERLQKERELSYKKENIMLTYRQMSDMKASSPRSPSPKLGRSPTPSCHEHDCSKSPPTASQVDSKYIKQMAKEAKHGRNSNKKLSSPKSSPRSSPKSSPNSSPQSGRSPTPSYHRHDCSKLRPKPPTANDFQTASRTDCECKKQMAKESNRARYVKWSPPKGRKSENMK